MSLTFQRHGLESRVDGDFLGGGKLHPLIRLAVDSSSAFSHVADIDVWFARVRGRRLCLVTARPELASKKVWGYPGLAVTGLTSAQPAMSLAVVALGLHKAG
jgi:hypothetical protein